MGQDHPHPSHREHRRASISIRGLLLGAILLGVILILEVRILTLLKGSGSEMEEMRILRMGLGLREGRGRGRLLRKVVGREDRSLGFSGIME